MAVVERPREIVRARAHGAALLLVQALLRGVAAASRSLGIACRDEPVRPPPLEIGQLHLGLGPRCPALRGVEGLGRHVKHVLRLDDFAAALAVLQVRELVFELSDLPFHPLAVRPCPFGVGNGIAVEPVDRALSSSGGVLGRLQGVEFRLQLVRIVDLAQQPRVRVAQDRLL